MSTNQSIILFSLTFLALGQADFAGAAFAGDGFIALTPDAIEFRPVPGREGLSVALLHGHPDKDGFYVMRVRFAEDMRTSPHFHDQDRLVTVISGTWHFGTGKAGTCEGTKPLGPGSFAKHPKHAVHYDGSCGGPVVVEISGRGPVKTTWVEAEMAD